MFGRIKKILALQNPAVWRGVNLVSQSVAKLPLIVYRRVDDDGRDRATSHPAYRLLKTSPSPLYSAYVFKRTLQSHAVLHGNAYAYILRDEFGKPVELLILDPEATRLNDEAGRYYYTTQMGTTQFNLPMSDVLHIKGLSPDGLLGFANVPPHKLGASITTSYSSLESENKAFLSDSLDGWLTNWEQECMAKLLSERAKTHDTHFIEFERKALIQTDAKTEIATQRESHSNVESC